MPTTREIRLQPTPILLSSTRYLWLVRFWQYVGYWPCRIVTRLFTTKRVTIDLQASDLSRDTHYLIASNHQSLVDPFVICSELPLKLWGNFGPFRYFAHAGLFENPVMRWFLLAFGSFPTRQFGSLPFGLEAARAYLGRGQTVVIFPEGRRTLPGEATPRSGVAILAEDPLVRVIPVHIQWTRHGYRRSYQLCVGRPLPLGQTPESVLKAIYHLPLP